MNTQDYPEHTAPEPPAGREWKYRGLGWISDCKATYYYIVDPIKSVNPEAETPSEVKSSFTYGVNCLHYFEAVPLVDEQKPSIKSIMEALCELRKSLSGSLSSAWKACS